METQTYTGACHCRAVTFEVTAQPFTAGMVCNCSHCHKKGLVLTFVPRDQFSLKRGESNLTHYTFNKGVIDHQFCATCGTQAFAYGADENGNEMAAINLRCIDDLDIDELELNTFNGKDY